MQTHCFPMKWGKMKPPGRQKGCLGGVLYYEKITLADSWCRAICE